MVKKDERARNWAVIIYPESAPENWLEKLSDYHVKTVVSPLHDKDIDEKGELKKPHYHAMVLFDGKKSYQQVYDLYTLPLCCTIPKKVLSVSGMARYFCHLDNTEKAQYPVTEMRCFGGADLKRLLEQTEAEKYGVVKEIVEITAKNNINEFSDAWDFAIENDLKEWFPVLTNNAYCINTLLRSRKYRDMDLV